MGHAAQMIDNFDDYIKQVDASESWKILKEDPRALLVDVRTEAEWVFVGVPDLSSLEKKIILLSWNDYPTMSVNKDFCEKLQSLVPDLDVPLLFICRSGGRSFDAAVAMAELGYKECYNISDGFEGELDANKHRSRRNGWKLVNLPWEQR